MVKRGFGVGTREVSFEEGLEEAIEIFEDETSSSFLRGSELLVGVNMAKR